MTDCMVPAAHHSADRVDVHHGRSAPTRMCGFHAQDVQRSLTAISKEEHRAR